MNGLTFTTCLAACTEEIVSAVSGYLSGRLGIGTRVVTDVGWRERLGLVADGIIDVGWICGSYYSRLMAEREPGIELLAAPVMAQPRYKGQPVYFSDVVVRADSEFKRFDNLRGATFAFNESGSMSGYWTMRYHLAQIGAVDGFFGRFVRSGSHLKSLRMIFGGEVDTAAIDSTVLDFELENKPELAHIIRIVKVLGPTPMPPWVVRRSLPEEVKGALRKALVGMGDDEDGRRLLDGLKVLGFTAVSDSYYDRVREMMGKAAVVDW